MVDNSEKIRKLLYFPQQTNAEKEHSEYFYVVQLLQREKDKPKKHFGNTNFRNNSNKSILQFQIKSLEDFDLKFPDIKELCDHYQCRAYINLNLRSSKNVFDVMMINMAIRNKTNNYIHLNRLFNEAAGDSESIVSKKLLQRRWIVDLDDGACSWYQHISSCITACKGSGKDGHGEVYETLGTPNGIHLITSPFNRQEMQQYMDNYRKDLNNFPTKLEIKDNNPTVLYFNPWWIDNIANTLG